MNKFDFRNSIFAVNFGTTTRAAGMTSSEPCLGDQVVRGLEDTELCAVGGGGIHNKIVNPPPPPPVL